MLLGAAEKTKAKLNQAAKLEVLLLSTCECTKDAWEEFQETSKLKILLLLEIGEERIDSYLPSQIP